MADRGHLQQNSGCVGVFNKSPSLVAEEKSKKRKASNRGIHGQPPQKDWWSSSSNEMETNLANSRSSQRSNSSISASNHNPEIRAMNNSTNNGGYVNHALASWNEQRRAWLGNRQRVRPQQPREIVLSWGPTYEDLLSTNRPFERPIPLPEMVDFLVDVWEQEGLYD